jgi:hypothetical protein
MIQTILLNKLKNTVINKIAKSFKLYDLMKYMDEDNELDVAVRELKLENQVLKSDIAECKAFIKTIMIRLELVKK